MAALFAAPPPTTNALSATERARLLRSSNKIARVLGTTPRFLDAEVDDGTEIEVLSLSVYRNSVDTVDSISSTSTSTSNVSASTGGSSISSSSHSSRRSRKPLPLKSLQDVWPAQKNFRPKLSLSTSLASIPASPLTPTSPPESASQMSRTIPSSGYSPPSPSFTIPTAATARRRKLDRLRRTLGDDVPISLVFPHAAAESDSDSGSEPSLSSSSSCGGTGSEDDLATPGASPTNSLHDTEAKPAGKPLPRPPRRKKIANTRDSLFLASSSSSASKITRAGGAPPTPSPSPSMPPGLYDTPFEPSADYTRTHTGTLPRPQAQANEHGHRRSHSGAHSALGVIPEETGTSGWYASDCEDEDGFEDDFEFIREDEVLYGAPLPKGKGMGRGLARSYATASGV